MKTRSALIATMLFVGATAAFAADPPPLTGNIALASDYKFRGFTQTNYKTAIQGGFDYATKSGFYLGNWNSSVEASLLNGAPMEMDLYGGRKWSVGPLTYDIGVLYFLYRGSAQPTVDDREVYFGLGYGPISAKLHYIVGDYFAIQANRRTAKPAEPNGSTKGTTYLDLNANHDLGSGWGANLHIGVLNVNNGTVNGLPANSVADYKAGITKDISGWVAGAAYLTTSNKNFFTTGAASGAKSAGDANFQISLSKTF
jgi:uncharacterized protein (TIGR02001 family)